MFRGQTDATWPLLPGLSRRKHLFEQDIIDIEENAYFDFVTRAGDLLPVGNDSWANIFAMQHHGMPTRLLDWSETFAVALFFAMNGPTDKSSVVWILDPFALNKRGANREELLHPNDLESSYDEMYVLRTKTLGASALALSPLRHHPRVFHQKAAFTIHDDLTTPLDRLYPQFVTKVEIPVTARSGAEEFLKLAGVSYFSLFPDLDGLVRDLRREYLLFDTNSSG
jgi:hypothetical protein